MRITETEDLDLDASWRLGEATFAYISDLIKDNNLTSMIEFGSGASTVRWALAFRKLAILSLEHDLSYLQETQEKLEHYDVRHRVQLHHAKLSTVWIDGKRFSTYSRPPIEADRTFDIAVIDGPPSFTRRGREACLYYAYDYLRLGAIVLLDDASRPEEQAITANWLAVYPGSFEVNRVGVGHGLIVLRKTKHLAKRHASRTAFFDSYSVNTQQLSLRLKSALKSRIHRAKS